MSPAGGSPAEYLNAYLSLFGVVLFIVAWCLPDTVRLRNYHVGLCGVGLLLASLLLHMVQHLAWVP